MWLVIIAMVVVGRMLPHHGSQTTRTALPTAAPSVPALSILAGSELKDLEFLQPEMERAAGMPIHWTYSGTLDMVDALNQPPAASTPHYDFAWAASGKYLSLAAPGKIKNSEKIMLSPVILGVKQSVAHTLGWDRQDPTWAEVAAAARAGKFRYGMTNPTASNSGFCATVGVAAALAGKTDGLTAADIPTDALKGFFSGQRLTAGSSGWLADAYVRDPDRLDGLINYESVILSLNEQGKLSEPLTPVYPKEGIITSDYPLMLLDESQRPAYDKLVAFLRSDGVQQQLMQQTHRRPVSATVKPAAEFGDRLLIELPFPATLDTIDTLLLSYQNELRRPGHAFFVLDTSGSMEGERIAALRAGLEALNGGGHRFSRIALREKIDLLPFAEHPYEPIDLNFGDAQSYDRAQQQFEHFIRDLHADGGTAIYDTLLLAYRRIAQDMRNEPDRYYSIVLMTDGENTDGHNFEDFKRLREGFGDEKAVRVFPILFGDSSTAEMKRLAELTGGKTFDGHSESLVKVFQEIRGYQ